MELYEIVDAPELVPHEGASLLAGYYRAEFTDGSGGSITRFLTDKGRTEVLRRIDDGQRSFTPKDLEELTVPPDVAALEERMDREAGEGA